MNLIQKIMNALNGVSDGTGNIDLVEIDDVREILEKHLSKLEWVDPQERPPKDGKRVEIKLRNGDRAVGFLHNELWWIVSVVFHIKEVEAWRPLID